MLSPVPLNADDCVSQDEPRRAVSQTLTAAQTVGGRWTDRSSVMQHKHFQSEGEGDAEETDGVTAAGRLGGTAGFFWNVLLFPHQGFSFDPNQTLYFQGALPAGPSTSAAGFCVCLPSPDPFIVLQYWFRNKSGRLIHWSTFPNKRAGRSCCVWRASPHGAVFIVSPPLTIHEKFPDGD